MEAILTPRCQTLYDKLFATVLCCLQPELVVACTILVGSSRLYKVLSGRHVGVVSKTVEDGYAAYHRRVDLYTIDTNKRYGCAYKVILLRYSITLILLRFS
jgi:hypothetical protein